MREITQLATFGECGDNEFVGKIVDGIWEVMRVQKKGITNLKTLLTEWWLLLENKR